MEQVSIFDYIDESRKIGTVTIDKNVLKNILSVMSKLSGKMYYLVSNGAMYGQNLMEQMAIMYKSKILSVEDTKSVFTIDTASISKILKLFDNTVTFDIYENAIKLAGKKISKAMLVQAGEPVKIFKFESYIRNKKFFKIKVSPDIMVKSINWIIGTGSIKHKKVKLIIDSGKFMLYDYKYDKDGEDEARAVISSVATDDKFESTYSADYMKILSSFISSLDDLKLYINTDDILVAKGNISVEGKMKDIKEKITAYAAIAPIVLSE